MGKYEAMFGMPFGNALLLYAKLRIFSERRALGGGEFHEFSAAHVLIVGISAEHARANFHKSYAAAVVGVHIGVNFEYEA